MALYIARVQRLTDNFFKGYKELVYSLLNKSHTSRHTISWERLTVSSAIGGYGLLDLELYNAAALMSWIFLLQQWCSGELTSISLHLLFNLMKMERINRKSHIPIFIGFNYYKSKCKFLDDLSWASRRFYKYWKVQIGDAFFRWNMDDSIHSPASVIKINEWTVLLNDDPEFVDSGMLFPSCDNVSNDDIDRFLLLKIAAMTNTPLIVRPLSQKLSSIVHKPIDFIYTTAQSRWINEYGINACELICTIKYLSLKRRTLNLFKDMLHIRLRTCYKSDICLLCGQIIGSSHFFRDCEQIKLIWPSFCTYPFFSDFNFPRDGPELRIWVIISVSTWLAHAFASNDEEFNQTSFIYSNLSFNSKKTRLLALEY
jgi:hypothetical protein